MKALIIRATGATGKDLVNVLLQDPAYEKVVVFVRRAGGITHPKLTEVLTDFDNLEAVAGAITGDAWFSCLGTTLKTAGSKERRASRGTTIASKHSWRHKIPRRTKTTR